MPYFSFTRLNQNLSLLPVIVFQHFKALWKAEHKKQIALKENLHNFSFFLNRPLGFENFAGESLQNVNSKY